MLYVGILSYILSRWYERLFSIVFSAFYLQLSKLHAQFRLLIEIKNKNSDRVLR